jgi:virginiamycin B lyase
MSALRTAAARCVVALAAAAGALAQSVVEYPIPRSGAFPHDPAVGNDGRIWYTDQSNSYIGVLDPATGAFQDWPTPTPSSGPHGITVTPDGFVWYTAQSVGRLGRVNPSTGAITEFVLPANANRPHTPIAHRGEVWFTCQTNATYGRLDPGTGNATIYPAPAGSRPYGIFPAPDGFLWIALFGTNKLGRVDPVSGALALYDLPNAGARPRRLTVSNDGIVWYTDYPRGYLGRLDPVTRGVTEWLAPAGSPYGIAVGTDGRIWFHASASSLMVAFDPRTAQMQTVPIPTSGAIVRHMVCDFGRGKLWLALSGTQRIGRIQLVVPVQLLRSACSGSLGLPVLSISGIPRIGETVTCGVSNTAATAAALLFGISSTSWNGLTLPVELAVLASPGCFVNSSWDLPIYSGAPRAVALSVPIDSSLGGGVFFLQWGLLGDSGGPWIATTASAQLTVVGQ